MLVKIGETSFWWSSHGGPPRRPSAPGDLEIDIAIVGAGFTGLWLAYYLSGALPEAKIAVFEQRHVGYGASGRNGGWLTSGVPGGRHRYLKTHGRASTEALQVALSQTVDEVIEVADHEGIQADIVKGGTLAVARNTVQAERLWTTFREERRWPTPPPRWLNQTEVQSLVNVAGAQSGFWQPQCARLDPVALVLGLANAVESRGVTIYENTAVSAISPRRLRTSTGEVAADYIVQGTEGFGAAMPGQARRLLPMNSSMIVTEPLGDDVWAEVGWDSATTLRDGAHAYFYAQRTADGRIAIGGRGKPYRYGSLTDFDGDTASATVRSLTELLRDLFPAAHGVGIAHAWSGVLGVPRDWRTSVNFDRTSGLGWIGGYAGTGVAAANLAARTMTELVAGLPGELSELPWVNHQSRLWEPEPVRWLGVQAMYGAYRYADRTEAHRSAGTSAVARVADRLSGMHG